MFADLNQIKPELMHTLLGIEVETHRVDRTGALSTDAYPKKLLDQKQHHFIKNDFLDTQSELITQPLTTTKADLVYLGDYQQALRKALASDERLWPYSMPPKVRNDRSDIRIAQTDEKNYLYRQEVARRRKIQRTAETGVHVNLGLTDEQCQLLELRTPKDRDLVYLKEAHGFLKYRWLLTYLFGASPVAFAHYFTHDENTPTYPVRSLRNSHFGFGNGVMGNYVSVHDYAMAIEKAVASGQLIAKREFYGIVRLKAPTFNDLLAKGVDYIEIRTLDLDPFAAFGISAEALNFFRLLFAYFALHAYTMGGGVQSQLQEAQKKNDTVALEPANTRTVYETEGREFLDKLKHFIHGIKLDFDGDRLLTDMTYRFAEPDSTPSGRLVKMTCGEKDEVFHLLNILAAHYQAELTDRPLIGFEDETIQHRKEILRSLQQGIRVEVPNL